MEKFALIFLTLLPCFAIAQPAKGAFLAGGTIGHSFSKNEYDIQTINGPVASADRFSLVSFDPKGGLFSITSILRGVVPPA